MNSMVGSRGPTGGDSGGLSRGVGPGMKAPTGYKSFQQYGPEAMQLYQQMMGNVGPDSYLSKLAGGDQSMFAEMEAPALRQFSGMQGNLASRFSGMGMGARNSSGHQNTQNAAMSDFASQLQSQRQGLQRQAIMDLAGISSNLLDKEPYGLYERGPKKPSKWGGAIGALGGGALGFFAGGPVGAMQGASMGYGVGSQF